MMSGYRVRESRERFLREEREEQEARLAPLKNQLNATATRLARESAAQARDFWGRPLQEIANDGPNASGAFDDLGLPQVDGTQTDVVPVFKRFLKELPARTGFTLDRPGEIRFGSFVTFQRNYGVEITQQSLQTMFDRLVALNCFADGELGFDESLRTVHEPKPETKKPTLDELFETVSGETREGSRTLRNAVREEVYGRDVSSIFTQWLQSMSNNFSGFYPTDQQQKTAINFLKSNNLPMLSPRSYDRCRVALVKQGIFPEHLLTDDERLAQSLEGADLSSYASRREFQKRSAQLHPANPEFSW